MADNDASGWKNGWMDDFYNRMTKMIIAVSRQSPSLTSEWRRSGGPMSECMSDVRVVA